MKCFDWPGIGHVSISGKKSRISWMIEKRGGYQKWGAIMEEEKWLQQK